MADNRNYDEMMDATLSAYAQSTNSIPDPQTFTEIEQKVVEYVQEQQKQK